MLVVPLKFMCSTQCETPVNPARSSFEPTLYQHHTEASGAVCSSCTRTVRPLSRVARRSIGIIIKLLDIHARVERHRQPAADRIPYEGEPPDGRARVARTLERDGPLRENSRAPER